MDLKIWDKVSKESFAVAVCSGAMYNLNLKQSYQSHFCSLNAVINNPPIKPRFIKKAL